jgi:hypothetical protein
VTFVEVEWVDSMTLNDGGWLDHSDVDDALEHEALRHRTVGVLIKETAAALAVAAAVNDQPDGQESRAACVIVIPKAAVLARHELRRIAAVSPTS